MSERNFGWMGPRGVEYSKESVGMLRQPREMERASVFKCKKQREQLADEVRKTLMSIQQQQDEEEQVQKEITEEGEEDGKEKTLLEMAKEVVANVGDAVAEKVGTKQQPQKEDTDSCHSSSDEGEK